MSSRSETDSMLVLQDDTSLVLKEQRIRGPYKLMISITYHGEDFVACNIDSVRIPHVSKPVLTPAPYSFRWTSVFRRLLLRSRRSMFAALFPASLRNVHTRGETKLCRTIQ